MNPNRPGICRHPICGYPVHRDRDGHPYRYCRPHGLEVSNGEMGQCCSGGGLDVFTCELANGHPVPHRYGALTWD